MNPPTGLLRGVMSTFVGRVVRRYLGADAGVSAQVIAWNALFAFFPIVLVSVTALGVVLHDPGFAAEVEHRAAAAVGGSADDQRAVVAAFEAFRQRTGLLAVLGFAGLLWSGTGLIGALERGFSTLCSCPPRGFLRQRLMGIGMILTFTVLTIPLVLSSSVLAVIRQVPGVPAVLSSGPLDLLLQVVIGVLDGALLLSALFLVVPNRSQRLRDVVPGAVAGGILLETLTLVFPLYFTLSNGFATYGRTFALFFVLLTYFFFLGQIVMVGATVNAEFEAGARARRRAPRPG